MVVRRDTELEAIGKMADLPPDHTPLQIGARGICGTRRFRLLGRLRVGWDDGFWNEWYADFGDGKHGWVAESQGFFLISEAAAASPDLPRKSEVLRTGKPLEIAGTDYTVTDVKKARVVAGEGELPFVARPYDEWVSIDLTGPGRKFASIERQNGEVRLHLGESAQPEEIIWEGLRPVPGWKGEPVPVEKNRTDAMPCPECGGVIVTRATGMTMSLVCGHCGTVVNTSASGKRAMVAQKIKASQKLARPLLPLGKRGHLRGVEWEVIGALKRKDAYSQWNEFLLYNPWHGFLWLTEWSGHWNLIRRVLESPLLAATTYYRDTAYKLFSQEKASVSQVAGEFYWRVRVGEMAVIADYIAPPRILSAETYEDLNETTWSEGEYLPANEIAAAFGVKFIETPAGVFANQPNPWAARWPTLKKYTLYAVLALLGIQLLSMGGANRQVVLDQSFTFQQPSPGTTAAPIVTPSFELRGKQSPARVKAHAAVNNAWLGLDADLVNETTGQIYPAPITVQYYHGYDDGPWKEGKQDAATDLPAVPPGRYHLALTPEADPSIKSLPFQIRIERGGVFWSNFFLCLFGIAIWPVWAFFRHHSFEAKRWSQSDYSPYASSTSDE
jgi:ribosomal protein S27AE